jgi:hypothetical protein
MTDDQNETPHDSEDTPLATAAAEWIEEIRCFYVSLGDARNIERKLNAALAKLKEAEKEKATLRLASLKHAEVVESRLTQVTRERDEAKIRQQETIAMCAQLEEELATAKRERDHAQALLKETQSSLVFSQKERYALSGELSAVKQERDELKRELDWQNNRNSGHPTKGGFEFYINEEWTGLANAALDAYYGWHAALRKNRIDPDDERVRIRRVVEDDAILAELSRLQAACGEKDRALGRIWKWFDEFPVTGRTWDDGSPMSYGACYGSNGERDYMRQIAHAALATSGDTLGEEGKSESARILPRVIAALKEAYANAHQCDLSDRCPGCMAGYALEDLTGRKWTQEECENESAAASPQECAGLPMEGREPST